MFHDTLFDESTEMFDSKTTAPIQGTGFELQDDEDKNTINHY